MQFQLFGGLAARSGDRPLDLGSPKQQAVLAALLLEPGRAVGPERLADLVWGDAAPPRADASLQAYVSNLRRVLEPDRPPRSPARLLLTERAGYRLAVAPEQVDVARFAARVAEGRMLLERGDARAAATALDEALALSAAPLLPELADEPWVRDAQVRLSSLRRQAADDRVAAGLQLGEHQQLVPFLEAAIAEDPYHERLRAQLAVALYRSGRTRDALNALAEARRVLVEEVGIDPGPELRAVEAGILDHDPALAAPAAAVGSAPRPSEPARPTSPSEPARSSPPSEPPPEPVPSSTAFVGREAELAQLLDAYRRAEAGSGCPVVVSGEAGAGKTRLVEELVARVSTGFVAWGRCPERATGEALLPLMDVARQLEGFDAIDPVRLARLTPAGAAALGTDAAAERLALHRATVDVLRTATRPLVVVLDDLHWADDATLRLVEYVAGELRTVPVLLVVTTRPPGPDAPAFLIETLGELARASNAVRLELGGLRTADIEAWLGFRGAGGARAAVARTVHDRTGGNAFFVGEVIALLANEGLLEDEAAAARRALIPAAVQDVVRRRVGRLPGSTQQLLSIASVAGRSFDLDLVAAMGERDLLRALDELEAALAADLVEETDLPGRLQFSHQIVADTLLAELSPARRARMHAAALQALLRLRAADLDRHAAVLAHHAMEGLAAGTAEPAYDWSLVAARQATEGGAHDVAARHWAAAASALELAWPDDLRARFEARYEEGLAWLRVDDVERASPAFVAAIDLAIELGDPELVGEAASRLDVEGVWTGGELLEAAMLAAPALERALAAIPSTATATRALLLGVLADDGYWFRPVDAIERMSAEAVALARTTGDRALLGRLLHKRNQVLWRPSTFEARRAAAEELIQLVEEGGLPPALEAAARLGYGSVAWEGADVTTAMAEVRAGRAVAQGIGSPALITQLGFFQSVLHSWLGEVDLARNLLEETYDLYRRTRGVSADEFYAGFVAMILVEEGDYDGVDAVARPLLEGKYAAWFSEAVWLARVLAGRPEDVPTSVARSLPPAVDGWFSLGADAMAALVRVGIGDLDGAVQLAARLEPYSGRLATIGTGAGIGDVDLVLATVANATGDRDKAVRHIRRSLDTLERNRAVRWLEQARRLGAELGVHPA